ncbi:zinc finger CCHC domain-containing protein 3-like [Hyperolius riggenbachi]|uniref:zinc finger CCHC domain-containing protein 3-like n=1 Tax=Hyperolius riggenbachi TaxID=752182 RepID=UPI0035A3A9F3
MEWMEAIFGLGPSAPRHGPPPPPVSTAISLDQSKVATPAAVTSAVVVTSDGGDTGLAGNAGGCVVEAGGGATAEPEPPGLKSMIRVGFPALGPAQNPGALAPLAASAQGAPLAHAVSYSKAVRGPAPGRRVVAPLETELEAHTPGRRNVVRLKWDHVLLPIPTKRQFVKYLLDLGVRPADLFAILAPGDPPQYYDVSFLSQQGMESFLEERLKESENNEWHCFKVVPQSKQTLERKAHIVVQNESIPVRDLMTWVQHYVDIMSPPHKVLDELGIWWGEYEVAIRLRAKEGVVTHIPRSALIGRDKVITYYPGQPRTSNRCDEFNVTSVSNSDTRIQSARSPGRRCPRTRREPCLLIWKRARKSVSDPNVSVQSVPAPNVSVSSVNPSAVAPSPSSL